jgi:hypothetical protein
LIIGLALCQPILKDPDYIIKGSSNVTQVIWSVLFELLAITIKSLKEIGNALEMKFVYGFIPIDGSIDSLLDRRSRIPGEKIMFRTNQNMMLENQEIDKSNLRNAIEANTRTFQKK